MRRIIAVSGIFLLRVNPDSARIGLDQEAGFTPLVQHFFNIMAR